jgi:large subunit ribosomal protein L17
MRHGRKVNHLGRQASHRKALMSNMACSLIEHKRIHTTLAKAKALKVYFEPLVTKSKNDSTHSRRTVFTYLQSKDAVTELFRTVAPKVGDRPGGYTRIIKTGPRQGDGAEMCFIELVDFNELMLLEKAGAKKTTRRSRRSGTKKSDGPATETQKSTPVETSSAEPTAEGIDTPVADATADESEAPDNSAEESTGTEDTKE